MLTILFSTVPTDSAVHYPLKYNFNESFLYYSYYGEKLSNDPGTSSRKRRADKEVIISSIYDDPEDTDPTEPLLRSRGPYHLKYRAEVKFKKGESSDDVY